MGTTLQPAFGSLSAGESIGETAAAWKVSVRQEGFGGDSPL